MNTIKFVEYEKTEFGMDCITCKNKDICKLYDFINRCIASITVNEFDTIKASDATLSNKDIFTSLISVKLHCKRYDAELATNISGWTVGKKQLLSEDYAKCPPTIDCKSTGIVRNDSTIITAHNDNTTNTWEMKI